MKLAIKSKFFYYTICFINFFLLDAAGVSVPDNLVFLDEDETLVGTYKFSEVDVKNLKVDGRVDDVIWEQVPNELFYLTGDQTIDATWTFDSPTKEVVFDSSVEGNSDDGSR